MAAELRIIVDERTLRAMGRAKRRAQELGEQAAKKQREEQRTADEALVTRNLALQLLKTESVELEDARAPIDLLQIEAEAEAQVLIEQARARVLAEREAKAKREARLGIEMAKAIKKRLAADRAAHRANKDLTQNTALRAMAAAGASASPKHKQPRLGLTPQTLQQPRKLTFIDVVDAFRPERLSRRGQAEEVDEATFLAELKRRREEKRARQGGPPVEAALGTPAAGEEQRQPVSRTLRARRAISAGAAPASASVDTLLGQLWTARVSPTQAVF